MGARPVRRSLDAARRLRARSAHARNRSRRNRQGHTDARDAPSCERARIPGIRARDARGPVRRMASARRTGDGRARHPPRERDEIRRDDRALARGAATAYRATPALERREERAPSQLVPLCRGRNERLDLGTSRRPLRAPQGFAPHRSAPEAAQSAEARDRVRPHRATPPRRVRSGVRRGHRHLEQRAGPAHPRRARALQGLAPLH